MGIVRPLSVKMQTFKNVGYGCVELPSLGSAKSLAEIKPGDVTGIYGPNGSGKTSLVEAFELLRYVLMGMPVPFRAFSGMLTDKSAEIAIDFLIEEGEGKYYVTYGIVFSPNWDGEIIRLEQESFSFKERGYRWKKERTVVITNGMYQEAENLFSETDAKLTIKKHPKLGETEILDETKARKLASYCAMRGLSMLFCNAAASRYDTQAHGEVATFYHLLKSLRNFAIGDLIIVGVSQLGEVNTGLLLPLNVHLAAKTEVVTGCLPLFQQGEGEMPEHFYTALEKSLVAVNQVLHAIIPGLSIHVEQSQTYTDEKGTNIVRVRTYAQRDGAKFLTRYESEGIKRIISLLHAIVFAYNCRGACLVVDELDAGIFEYLLGDLVSVMFQNAKGQLIFTSHNLRILETIPCRNAVFTTTNKENRFIKLKVSGHNNNVRDSYLRALSLGGQEEELYSEMELDPLSFALRDAWDTGNGGDA